MSILAHLHTKMYVKAIWSRDILHIAKKFEWLQNVRNFISLSVKKINLFGNSADICTVMNISYDLTLFEIRFMWLHWVIKACKLSTAFFSTSIDVVWSIDAKLPQCLPFGYKKMIRQYFFCQMILPLFAFFSWTHGCHVFTHAGHTLLCMIDSCLCLLSHLFPPCRRAQHVTR